LGIIRGTKKGLKTADPGSGDDADTIEIDFVRLERGVLQREPRRRQSEL
jgi:hypothetical protein